MSVSTADKKFTINFTEAKKTKFCLSMHYNGHISYLFVIAKKKINKSKANNKNVNFLPQFCLENISKSFGNIKSEQVSF